jgi:hypothetical protein
VYSLVCGYSYFSGSNDVPFNNKDKEQFWFNDQITRKTSLKVPKREIFNRSDFPDFYTIKSSWVGELLVKVLTYYFNF